MLVPPVWHLEVANILGLKQRDNHLSPLEVRQAIAVLRKIPTETSWAVALDAVHLNLERIARYRIAAYDALYVELARTTGLPLVTYDRAMIRAARETGITVLST